MSDRQEAARKLLRLEQSWRGGDAGGAEVLLVLLRR